MIREWMELLHAITGQSYIEHDMIREWMVLLYDITG